MQLSIMSFNIRGSFHDEDGINAWENRADLNIRTIHKYNPDVIGFQEAQTGNLADYETHLSGYTIEQSLPSIRQNEKRHYVPIYYRTDRFQKVQSGGFYLSESPDDWSIGWDAPYPRAVTWIVLNDKSADQKLLVLNTHFNHEQANHHSRTESAKLIIERINALELNIPKIVMADFNARPESDAYRIFTEKGYQDTFVLAGCEDNPNTVHVFQGEDFPFEGARIDWILLHDQNSQLCANACDVILDHEGDIYPSDHYPIQAILEWKKADA